MFVFIEWSQFFCFCITCKINYQIVLRICSIYWVTKKMHKVVNQLWTFCNYKKLVKNNHIYLFTRKLTCRPSVFSISYSLLNSFRLIVANFLNFERDRRLMKRTNQNTSSKRTLWLFWKSYCQKTWSLWVRNRRIVQKNLSKIKVYHEKRQVCGFFA